MTFLTGSQVTFSGEVEMIRQENLKASIVKPAQSNNIPLKAAVLMKTSGISIWIKIQLISHAFLIHHSDSSSFWSSGQWRGSSWQNRRWRRLGKNAFDLFAFVVYLHQ